jgi:hypothetical protein
MRMMKSEDMLRRFPAIQHWKIILPGDLRCGQIRMPRQLRAHYVVAMQMNPVRS